MAWTQQQRSRYLAANPDVAAAGVDPEQHYTQFGQAEMESGQRNAFSFTPSTPSGSTGGTVPGTSVGSAPVPAPQATSTTVGSSSAPTDWTAYLNAPGNQDIKAAVEAGQISAQDHWNTFGQYENRQTGNQSGGSSGDDYASRYHEIRGIGIDFDALGMDVPDYTQTPVNTAAYRNQYHYVNPQTGQLNKDLLRSDIQSGAFRFNPDYYAAQNPDLAAAGITSGTDLMEHFLNFGWNEGRNYAIGDPHYVNATQTQAQADAGFDPIAARLLSLGQTPAWGTSGFGFGTAQGHRGGRGGGGGGRARILSREISDILGGAYNDNVQQNIADVIAPGSPLMTLAETRARQVANSRGLLNSSMAVNAGQDAVLNVAIPIGSQQASQNWQTNENARGFGYQSDLLGQELDWRGTQAGLDRQHQLTQQNNDIAFRSAEASLDRSLQERLQTWNLNATEADNAARQMYGAQTLLQNSLVNINANTNLNAEQRTSQIAQARADFDMMMALIEQIYQVDLSWAA